MAVKCLAGRDRPLPEALIDEFPSTRNPISVNIRLAPLKHEEVAAKGAFSPKTCGRRVPHPLIAEPILEVS